MSQDVVGGAANRGRGRELRWPWRLLGWLGVALHLAVGVLPYSASGLLAPSEGVAVLWAIWAGLLVGALVLVRRGSRLVLLVPVLALAVWVAVMTFGDVVLGWTA